MKNSEKSRFVTVTGIVAGLYAALTVGLAPLSFGLVQCRAAELLTVLAVYTPAAVPGLTVGCVISNLIGLAMGANIAGALDVVLGPLATGLAAWLSYRLRRQRIGGLPVLSTLPPVLLNALIVGTELAAVSPAFTTQVWFTEMALVGAGQLVACVGGGLVLARVLQKSGLDRRLEQNRFTNR